MKKKALFILILLLVCMSTLALAETWYVKTPNGKTLNMRRSEEHTSELQSRI